jgi:phospholipid-translocating ATPase
MIEDESNNNKLSSNHSLNHIEEPNEPLVEKNNVISLDVSNKNKNNKNKLEDEEENCFVSFLRSIFPCFKKIDTKTRREVYFRNYLRNITLYSNEIKNNKYNIFTFFPLVLFNQFSQFGNAFYLVMTITQFIDVLVVGFLFSYLSPLCIVVAVSMAKEFYDDYYRIKTDRKTNSEIYIKYERNIIEGSKFQLKNVLAKDIKIGDIIEVPKNKRAPADLLILKTLDNKDNNCFIRTDQLDGETDWKLRKAPGYTQNLSIEDIISLNGNAEYEPPSKLIYNFEGVLNITDENNKIIKEPLNLENTFWMSTVSASCKIVGIVIYTGNETRARMNSSKSKIKRGLLDYELNLINVYLFVIMFVLALILTLLKNSYTLNTVFVFFRFIVLFCGIIPIALRVNLDVSKTFFSYEINRDENIKNTIARNSTIPEELGRISYLFSDKTGTLTKNEMIFKNIAMENDLFSEQSFNDLLNILNEECKKFDAPLMDIINLLKNQNDEQSSMEELKRSKRIRRNRNKLIRDTITAMILCNNVTPIIDSEQKVTYQASSPDEVALVKFAETLNMKLNFRTDKEIKFINANEIEESYDILANFPFSSDTKRMGILLRNKKYNHIIFYLKGAENVILKYVKEEYKGYIKENAENLADKGLRTLVLTQKIVSEEFYQNWKIEYDNALTSMENRKGKIAEAISKLENDLDFLCVTGVEDLLQDNVNTTIDKLRDAGIKIWMLTGDKIETATCISISTGLKAKSFKLHKIRFDTLPHESDEEDISIIKDKLLEYNKLNTPQTPYLLIIDGDSLDIALKHHEAIFFGVSKNAPSVVCCRCSPTQKRIIVKTIKKYVDARTAAVGDGGNDVAMIQEADVGIGIVGKEGLQASLASDYSILQFDYLSNLILWWGRLSYKNTCTMANFVIHRGLIISLIQFIFSLMFYYNSVALYNGVLIMGYSTIYTCLPSISVLLDEDTDRENCLKFPNLYNKLLKGREMNLKNFLWWVFKSIFQASIIMFGSIFLFKDQLFIMIVTVTFTALIFLEILNVYTEINKFHPFMVFCLLATGIVYLLTLILFKNILDVASIFEGEVFLKILLIAIASWLPFFLINRIKKKFFPETAEKLNLVNSNNNIINLD